MRLKVVAVTGNPAAPSRTQVLAAELLSKLASLQDIEPQLVELAKVGKSLGRSSYRSELAPDAEHALRTIEVADVLIAATPVFRGSYTGLFKHVFDLIDQHALVGVPVILAAMGGSEKHCLMIEYQLRPLFSFFKAYTVPITVYATGADFTGAALTSMQVQSRIESAATQALGLARPRGLTASIRPALTMTASA